MANYTYDELERIANAVRNVWAANYNGGILPGMSKAINTTGDQAFAGLQGDVIEVIGGSLFSGLPLRAIISMGAEGIEEALRIQNGYSPYDMKPGFLRSPKAKQGKKGKYFIIPFRHMTPKSTGILGKKMSPSVHKASMRGEKFSEQIGTVEDPSDFGLVNSKGYQWQSGPYAGMTNIRDPEGRHSQFRTFRIVTDNPDNPSAPNSWWHPGVESNDVIGATIDYVTPYIQEGLKRAAKTEVIEKINEIFSHPLSV